MFEDLRLRFKEGGGRGVVSGNDEMLLVSLPGVELKTEYSSANVGVQPLRSSKLFLLFLGVWKSGLGRFADVGVLVGVGG